VQETTRIGVVFIPEGRYRLGKDAPGFQEGTGMYMVHFADSRPQARRPFSDGTEFTFYSAMSNIDFEMQEGNPAAVAVRFHVARHSYLQHMDFHIGSAQSLRAASQSGAFMASLGAERILGFE
jgi:hypothetical protein